MARKLIYKATEQDIDRTVSDVIRNQFGLVAHDVARAKYRTENGITVDGRVVMVNHRLKAGEELVVILAGEEPGKIVPAEGPLDILYEDEDVIALNKPAGLVVHPSHGHFADTLANFLAKYYLDHNDPHEIRMAGRLDKDTSGVIVFGKSRTATAFLAGQIGEETRNKVYLAAARGRFEEEHGDVEAPISREYEEKIKRVVREDGDYALTHYRVLKQFDDYAILAVTIETGRTHQIRVHMAHIGHPLLGDPIYGNGIMDPAETTGRTMEAYPEAAAMTAEEREERVRENHGFRRAALHAWKLTFNRPFGGGQISLTAPLPEDMARVSGEGEFLNTIC